jgi:hypothetical protein
VTHEHVTRNRSHRNCGTFGTVIEGGRGAAILMVLRTPLGSLRKPGFAGPGAMPLMAEFPAPADPAIGEPVMLWADAEADIPATTVSARASLIEAFNIKNSFCFRVHW